MKIFNKKLKRNKLTRLEKAISDLKKMELEIAPFIKRETEINELKEQQWQKSSIFLHS